MPFLLPCFYLDEPLDEEDLAFVRRSLTGHWARFKTGAADVEQRRVPAVLPAPDEHGRYADTREERAERIRANLRHAGIRQWNGRQVLWVMPRDTDWDAIFQFAIREETGFGPYVAQRWFPENGVLVRNTIRIVDTDAMLRRL
ncbi:hypothetical protein [Noviherbaspirillum galbum]|uniref:Uncharacterized protein n=1 Tax=Noviherbaspirillum galbum TaxID=2709383 RepID=A0A6B3SS89_9BURK|nr:hypothetical protein [Noviherbaspirillum galbum]NEX63554.1 hypothetical protein [Noviherbaspirillum galbum]